MFIKPSGAKYNGHPPYPSGESVGRSSGLGFKKAGYISRKAGMAKTIRTKTGVKDLIAIRYTVRKYGKIIIANFTLYGGGSYNYALRTFIYVDENDDKLMSPARELKD